MRLRSSGMEFASEMVALALRHQLRVAEIPITYYPRGGESKLRSFRDGWRHLRFMLLLSPTPLFLAPGPGRTAARLRRRCSCCCPGPLRVGGFVFDFHFMFVASALAILGVQLIVLGLAAKSYASGELLDRRGPVAGLARPALHARARVARGTGAASRRGSGSTGGSSSPGSARAAASCSRCGPRCSA